MGISVGVLAFFTLTHHGALWLALKTDDVLEERARRVANLAWYGVMGMTLIVTGATLRIQPQVSANLTAHPWGFVFPALALAGLAGALAFRPRDARKAFLASGAYIVGMLTSAAFGLFPYVLPSSTDQALGLTIYNTAAAPYGLAIGLAWWIPGMLLVLAYTVFSYRHFGGKVAHEAGAY